MHGGHPVLHVTPVLPSTGLKNPRFLLVFPPLQYGRDELVRPDGTLALPYLDAALSAAGFESRILDASVGSDEDPLAETFYRATPLTNGLVRIGMSETRLLAEMRDADVIAVTSNFTQQTSRCFEIAALVRRHYPEKTLIAGGINARNLRPQFFARGFDVIFISEAEKAIVSFAHALRLGGDSVASVPGIAYQDADGIHLTGPAEVALDLDEYPMPSWHKLPNQKYWEISRIWGGKEGWMEEARAPRYAALFTSRGCPFRCTYCHISKERGGEAGDIANLRLHSLGRLEHELEALRRLDVEFIYINDDSFLAKKERVHRVLAMLGQFRFTLADVNGVNIVHLFKRHGSRLVVDIELLDALYAAGFRKLSLPFESGSQRLLDRYSSGKWSLHECDVAELVRQIGAAGLVADGNFMIGYPDETLDELSETFLLARRLMDAGLVGCQFFLVQPFPGTLLFDQSLANGQLAADWHWDDLGWSKGSPFVSPVISKEILKYSWSLVWKLLNRHDRVRAFADQLGEGVKS